MADNYGHGSQRRCVSSPRALEFMLTYDVLASIKSLEPYCSEFLIHAADNEGLQKGIDEKLVQKLAEWCTIPVTYAGGGRNLQDLDYVKTLSNGKVDLTIGSALDVFGGSGVTFEECVKWNKQQIDMMREDLGFGSPNFRSLKPLIVPPSQRNHQQRAADTSSNSSVMTSIQPWVFLSVITSVVSCASLVMSIISSR
jgi:hypothetical protein